jgi:hypothetical protein
MIGAMTKDEPHSISIKLSPTQVDDVVRAASHSRAPSISTLIADVLDTPASSASGKKASANGKRSTRTRAASGPRGYMPIGGIDPRMSRSLLRGLSILTCFGPDGGPRGIVEIAEELDMSPSTAHRYALTLVELGLLERSPTTRKYSLPGI